MRITSLSKPQVIEHCKKLGINVRNKSKDELIQDFFQHEKSEIRQSIKRGSGLTLLKSKIQSLADRYANDLNKKIISRKKEMKADDKSHYLIYQVLGISSEDGDLIDIYQNTGRFLYKYAGSFLEEATCLCLSFSNLDGGKTLVENTQGTRPKTFEIDFLDGTNAIEVKWRDATTDGDHITKEHTRASVIANHGYKPIRIMFYYPQRDQAKRIQSTLETVYKGIGGEYHAGEKAWEYIKNRTAADLKLVLTEIANKRINESKQS